MNINIILLLTEIIDGYYIQAFLRIEEIKRGEVVCLLFLKRVFFLVLFSFSLSPAASITGHQESIAPFRIHLPCDSCRGIYRRGSIPKIIRWCRTQRQRTPKRDNLFGLVLLVHIP